ncbi:MAG TPA: flagellar biosynthesis anti-sigma factor FlgM [Desulfovibrio sp.]|jgi:negative regulator of flagellin synthesis FlgM|uniref:flagellar biosynthesis anti-sigma factor FlgM n=1 Tax=Desulfovibrio TaxID=872 RepID=UPI000423371C|nr:MULTISPECIES: flagellar biosynthesis anti-sigma factor FlgM [Desulfovibrio]HMM37882.1 flagellar biosynthesis anti-sigma factor FlgM [Desulfovibrio sp.]
MEINKLIGELNPYGKQKVQETAKSDAAQRSSSGESKSGDVVNLSGDAKVLSAAMSAAREAPDVRTEKVRALKEQVRNGTYKPDIQKAARNLVRDDLSRIL